MKKIRAYLYGLIAIFIILGIGLFWYFHINSGAKESNNLEAKQAEVDARKASLDFKNSFDTLEYFKNILGTDDDGVYAWFKEHGTQFTDVKDRNEAYKLYMKLSKQGVSINGVNNYFNIMNEDIDDFNNTKALVVVYDTLGGLNKTQLLNLAKKAKQLGVLNIYTYSKDGWQVALSYYNIASAHFKAKALHADFSHDLDANISVNLTKDFPQIYVINKGSLDLATTKKLGSIPLVNQGDATGETFTEVE